jgi:hypothetical protein
MKIAASKVLDSETVLSVVQSASYNHPNPSMVSDTGSVTSRLDAVIALLGLIALQNAAMANKK